MSDGAWNIGAGASVVVLYSMFVTEADRWVALTVFGSVLAILLVSLAFSIYELTHKHRWVQREGFKYVYDCEGARCKEYKVQFPEGILR